MALVIGTNMASLNAQRHLSSSQGKSAVAMERLSTGMRINTGQDDAAGLAIGNRLSATIRGLNQAVRNANDGVSMAKAGDGALAEISGMLDRMMELVTEKGNGALDPTNDIGNINTEMDAIGTEIGNIIANAQFNGTNLLSGALAIDFQVGVDVADIYTLTTTGVTAALTNASTAVDITNAINSVSTARGEFGAAMTALESRSANTAALAENLTAARGQIMDADIAQETANMTKASVLQQAGIAVLAQANQTPNMVLSLLR
ncbi:MAG: flagellin FliC [Desulfobulbaceae bacterium]|nr:flagellin FliC [Desulfobulbaceae bacterium]